MEVCGRRCSRGRTSRKVSGLALVDSSCLFVLKHCIYLFERVEKLGEGQREREADSTLSVEQDAGPGPTVPRA